MAAFTAAINLAPPRNRCNKAQQAMLAEFMHANMALARGNTASPAWQSIWSQWVQKVKAKYRKFRDQCQGTGGGPATVKPLTDIELKVLEVVGRASVDGFANLETPLVPSAPSTEDAAADALPVTAQTLSAPTQGPTQSTPVLQQPQQPDVQLADAPQSSNPSPARFLGTSTRHRMGTQQSRSLNNHNPPRRHRTRRQRVRPADLLAQALDRNNELFRSTMAQAADALATAIRDAGQRIASAILITVGVTIEEHLEEGNLD
ncbi:hypothetical protein O0L34_g15925 [Tuta absoluta]|nr:hypothetical protein O0L34_g15925 [Tuta absoluta]